MDSTALDRRVGAEHGRHRRRQCLRAVDDDQQPAGGVQPADDQVREQVACDGLVLRGALSQPDRHRFDADGDIVESFSNDRPRPENNNQPTPWGGAAWATWSTLRLTDLDQAGPMAREWPGSGPAHRDTT
jgi:hypothetical protein